MIPAGPPKVVPVEIVSAVPELTTLLIVTGVVVPLSVRLNGVASVVAASTSLKLRITLLPESVEPLRRRGCRSTVVWLVTTVLLRPAASLPAESCTANTSLPTVGSM